MPCFSLGQCFFTLSFDLKLQTSNRKMALFSPRYFLPPCKIYRPVDFSVKFQLDTTLTCVAWAALKPYLESKSRDSASSLVCLMMKRSARPSSGICK